MEYGDARRGIGKGPLGGPILTKYPRASLIERSLRALGGRLGPIVEASMTLVVAVAIATSAGCTRIEPTATSGDGPSTNGGPDAGGASSGASELLGNVSVDGSSTVFPFSEAAAGDFKKAFPNVAVTVAVSGTGGGFKRFVIGETDISNASRPITAEEFSQCRKNRVAFLELPFAYDGLTLVAHPSNDWVDQLTLDQLKQIFLEGGASRWSEVKPGWPDTPIKIFSPGTDSGTYDYFREVVVGKSGAALRSDISVSEDDNVLVTGVAGEPGAIGFFGASYYFENSDRVRAIPIVNPERGQPVAPSAETIRSGAYAPFGRPLFIYVNAKSIRRPEMRKFVEFQIENAGRFAARVGYVALPDAIYASALDHAANRLTGTHYIAADGTKRSGAIESVYVESNRVDIEP